MEICYIRLLRLQNPGFLGIHIDFSWNSILNPSLLKCTFFKPPKFGSLKNLGNRFYRKQEILQSIEGLPLASSPTEMNVQMSES